MDEKYYCDKHYDAIRCKINENILKYLGKKHKIKMEIMKEEITPSTYSYDAFVNCLYDPMFDSPVFSSYEKSWMFPKDICRTVKINPSAINFVTVTNKPYNYTIALGHQTYVKASILYTFDCFSEKEIDKNVRKAFNMLYGEIYSRGKI